MKDIGLVLEGGGMRGAYTAGVLDAFIEEGIEIPYVIGVSSGATIGASYITRQKERCKRIYLKWSQDPRFQGPGRILKEHSYFGMDFLFEQLPNELERFDYQGFSESDAVLVSCLSNCDTGKSEYIKHKEHNPKYYMSRIIRACNSLPIISPHVKINKQRYLDGFLTDPMPINKSKADGNKRNIIIMTKVPGVEKKVSLSDRIIKNMVRAKYPKIGKRLDDTAYEYLRRLEIIEELEASGEAFVFRPKQHRLETRYDKNPVALEAIYNDGYEEAMAQMDNLKEWIENVN